MGVVAFFSKYHQLQMWKEVSYAVGSHLAQMDPTNTIGLALSWMCTYYKKLTI